MGDTDIIDKRTCYCWRPYYCAHKWCAPISPILLWGTQQMITEPTCGALTADCTDRLEKLSQPRKDLKFAVVKPVMMSYDFCEPILPIDESALTATASGRVSQLAEPKKHETFFEQRPQYKLGIGRPSTIAPTSPTARTLCAASRRTEQLAAPRVPVEDWKDSRPVPWEVSFEAKTAALTERVDELAQPVQRKDKPPSRPAYNFGAGRPSVIWKVRESARNAVASERTAELSKPMEPPPDYALPRPAEWEVTSAALNASPTARLKDLSVPCQRARTEVIQVNSAAFIVKRTSLRAVASARVVELSRPIER